MTNEINTMEQVHALLDPLQDGGVISGEQCDDLCNQFAQFLDSVRSKGIPTDERDWEDFQKLFDFANISPVVTPMNAANLCPEPRFLLNKANELRVAYNRNVAQQTRMARGERVVQLETARKFLAAGLNLARPTDLAILRNASEGNNAISCGYRRWLRTDNPAERENVVLWKENHPTNLESWRLRAEWESSGSPLFDVKVVEFDKGMEDKEIAKKFIDEIGDRTRFVSFSQIANSTGFRIPDSVIDAIWSHVQVRRLNCHVHIDGTMAWGAHPVDLSKPRCHSFVSSAHKWFLGPKETGILYMSPDKVENFAPSILAYDYKIEIVRKWTEMPKNALRFELIGQRDDVNIITLAQTQLMWNSLAARKPYDRVNELAKELIDLLNKTPGRWKFITPEDQDRRWGVIRVEAPQGRRAKSLYNWLYDAPWRIAGSGDDKTFRLCPHIYNTKADIKHAVDGMNAWFDSEKP